jgi:hypothetical protein
MPFDIPDTASIIVAPGTAQADATASGIPRDD